MRTQHMVWGWSPACPERGLTDPRLFASRRNVLSLSSGINSPGSLKWDLALCLLFVWLVCFFCIWKGVKSTGKVSCASVPPLPLGEGPHGPPGDTCPHPGRGAGCKPSPESKQRPGEGRGLTAG